MEKGGGICWEGREVAIEEKVEAGIIYNWLDEVIMSVVINEDDGWCLWSVSEYCG